HLSFNLGSQPGLFLGTESRLLLGLTPNIFLGPTSFGFLNKCLGFLSGAHTCLLTRLHPLDFLFHRAAPHLSPTAYLIFLRSFSRITLEVLPLLLGPTVGLTLFGLTQLCKHGFVCCLRSAHLSINLAATSVFSGSHLCQFPFDSFDFLIGDLAAFF